MAAGKSPAAADTASPKTMSRCAKVDAREGRDELARQRAAARRNIKKAAAAAKKKRTIAHLPKKTRTALGKQAAKVAKTTRA